MKRTKRKKIKEEKITTIFFHSFSSRQIAFLPRTQLSLFFLCSSSSPSKSHPNFYFLWLFIAKSGVKGMALGKWASSRAWPLREEGSWHVYKLAIGMAGGLDLLVPPFAQFKAKFSYLIFSLFCRLSKCINHTGLKAGWRVEFCAVNWKQNSRTSWPLASRGRCPCKSA